MTLVFVLALLPVSAHAVEVVVFDQYETTATIQDDSILIERNVRIRNVGKTPIIPGELHFRLYEERGDDKIPLRVSGFEAISDTNEKLGTKITELADETDVSVQLWNPLLPGFTYRFSMTYELDFDPSGIFFYEISLPREDTTIPIRNEQTSFVLADGYHVTYAPESNVGSLSGNTIVTWEGTDNRRVVEYSRLPLPKTGFRAVNVFWVLIILILAGFFIISIIRRRRGGSGGSYQQPQQQWQQPQRRQGPPGGWG